MMTTLNKCVLVIDQDLPVGVVANTAAVLSVSIGKKFPEMVGRDLVDHQGRPRAGITTVALPILKKPTTGLNAMRESMRSHEPNLTVFELISATRTTKSYEAYAEELKNTPTESLEYLGLAVCGQPKLVNKFTGNLGLMR